MMVGQYTFGIWLGRMLAYLGYAAFACLAVFVLCTTLSNGSWAILAPTAFIPGWVAWQLLDGLVMTRIPRD